MTYNKINQLTEGREKVMTDFDEWMKITLEKNPKYVNRLKSLFKLLKKSNIQLNKNLHDTITSNVQYTGDIINLLEFMNSEGIDATLFPLESLIESAQSINLVQGMQRLKMNNSLDIVTFKLLLQFSNHSQLLGDLLINFQDHAYLIERVVNQLTQFSAKHIDTVIRLITLLLNKNLYYFDCFDFLLKNQEHIDIIYEGFVKISKIKTLAENYFTIIENHPKNANILANIILLLHRDSIIENKENLLMASKLGVGAYHFLNHLQEEGMLNTENYKKVCRDNFILTHNEVIKLFVSLPLFEKFNIDELGQMLNLISSQSNLETHLSEFIEIVQKHQLTQQTHCKQ